MGVKDFFNAIKSALLRGPSPQGKTPLAIDHNLADGLPAGLAC